jgi:single-strand DNA-binding protein
LAVPPKKQTWALGAAPLAVSRPERHREQKKETIAMSLTNRVSLIGFLSKDAETKTTRNDARFTVLSLATKRSWKDRQTGEWQSKSTWHRIICWGRLADSAARFTKGAHLQVEGEITTREYTPQSGATKSITEVRAIQIAKLTRPKKEGESAPESQGAAA